MTKAETIMTKLAAPAGKVAVDLAKAKGLALQGVEGPATQKFIRQVHNLKALYQGQAEAAVGTVRQDGAIRSMLDYRKGFPEALAASITPIKGRV